MRVHLCLPHSVCVCVCMRAFVHACVRKPGPGSPSPSPLGALKNEGGNLRAAVIIHPSKQMGRRQGRSWERGGREGREGCRKEERESQMGGMKGGWGGYINSYLTVFGILHPGWPRAHIYISICLSVRLGIFRL